MQYQWQYANNQFSAVTIPWNDEDCNKSFEKWGFTRQPLTTYGVDPEEIQVFARYEQTSTSIPFDFIVRHRLDEISITIFVPGYPDYLALMNMITPLIVNQLHADLLGYQVDHEENRERLANNASSLRTWDHQV